MDPETFQEASSVRCMDLARRWWSLRLCEEFVPCTVNVSLW